MNKRDREVNSLKHVERPKASRIEEHNEKSGAKKARKWIIFIIIIVLLCIIAFIPILHGKLTSSNQDSPTQFFKVNKDDTSKKSKTKSSKSKTTTNKKVKDTESSKTKTSEKTNETESKKAEQNDKNNTYTVKSGDTLTTIAKSYNTTVANLEKINGLKGDTVNVGQIIKIK